MVSTLPAVLHAAARSARSAPAVALSTVAGTHQAPLRHLKPYLWTLGRGRCPQTATRLTWLWHHEQPVPRYGQERHILVVSLRQPLGHRALPPPAARVAALICPEQALDTPAGTAAWAGRPAGTARMPRAEAAQLADGDDRRNRQHVATTPECAPAILARMGMHRDDRTRESAATHRATPKGVLGLLSSDPGKAVRAAAAANPSTPSQTLRHLSRGNLDQKLSAASNPALPPDALEFLSRDLDTSVRMASAHNPSCPPDMLERFCQDWSSTVRSNALSNPACPPELLGRLIADAQQDDACLAAALTNPSCPPDVLAGYEHHHRAIIRKAVAANPNRATDAAERLALSPDWRVRARADSQAKTSLRR